MIYLAVYKDHDFKNALFFTEFRTIGFSKMECKTKFSEFSWITIIELGLRENIVI